MTDQLSLAQVRTVIRNHPRVAAQFLRALTAAEWEDLVTRWARESGLPAAALTRELRRAMRRRRSPR